VEFDESKHEEEEITFDYGATLNCFPFFCAFHLKPCRTGPCWIQYAPLRDQGLLTLIY
jgi:hypothetical protein